MLAEHEVLAKTDDTMTIVRIFVLERSQDFDFYCALSIESFFVSDDFQRERVLSFVVKYLHD